MSKENLSLRANLQYDLPASVVVFLVALPLCLGIALASGAPLFSGLIAGIVGGIVVSIFSKSSLSVSGPAAGLAVIVLSAIQSLPSFEAFLLAVALAGVIQILFGFVGAGIIGDFIPFSVIKGMLAAIGILLILKQIPHALGYDADYEGDEAFFQVDGRNTFSELWLMLQEQLSFGAIIISSISLIFLFWWDSKKIRKPDFLKRIPGPLVVVIFGILTNQLFLASLPTLAIQAEHLVAVPVANSFQAFLGQFSFPDFSQIVNRQIWIAALTLALVASVETLLSIEAVDKLDPFKRVTPTNRELMAQGIGNFTSGMIGGIPITSVIVRSSANVTSGARTRMSAIAHGILLLISVIAIPQLLNLIPLSALAAILIAVGYKLTKPGIFVKEFGKGWAHFIPFVVTIVAILFSDLLIGVGVGIFVAGFFILYSNFHSSISFTQDNNNCLIRFKKELSFIHKYELKRVLEKIPDNCNVLLDISNVGFIDLDNAELINEFIEVAAYRDIKVRLKTLNQQTANLIKTPEYDSL